MTITGTQLTGATAVKFGATAASSFTVNSAKITATAPAGSGDHRYHRPRPQAAPRARPAPADHFTYTKPDRTITARWRQCLQRLSPAVGHGDGGHLHGPRTPPHPPPRSQRALNWGDGSSASAGTITSGGAGMFMCRGKPHLRRRWFVHDHRHDRGLGTPANTAKATDHRDRAGYRTHRPGSHPPTVNGVSPAGFSGTVNPEGLATQRISQTGWIEVRALRRRRSSMTTRRSDQAVGSDFSAHTVSTTVSGLIPNALYHVRLVATNPAGTVTGPDQTFTTDKDPAPPAPVLGKAVNLTPISGLVFIKFPAHHPTADHISQPTLLSPKAKASSPSPKPAKSPPAPKSTPAKAPSASPPPPPNTAKPKPAPSPPASSNSPTQAHGIHKGLTTLSLLEGAFPGAPSYQLCTGPTPPTNTPTAHTARLNRRILNTLHSRDNHGQLPHQRPLQRRHRPLAPNGTPPTAATAPSPKSNAAPSKSKTSTATKPSSSTPTTPTSPAPSRSAGSDTAATRECPRIRVGRNGEPLGWHLPLT